FILVLLLGIASRVVYVDRPLDHRSLAPWREADYIQIARNFYRHGSNILYPQIDLRGDTPGYGEKGVPLVPRLWAPVLCVFGYNEALLRLPSAILGILTFFVFVRLCRGILPPWGALFATAAFALNPLLIYLGNAMQPDPLMLFLSLVAMSFIWRWDESARF